MKASKKLSYGQSNFEKIRKENHAYVDKTRFIEMIENEPNSYHFLIRPRKFGKSLFLSTLFHYYDLCWQINLTRFLAICTSEKIQRQNETHIL